MSLVSAPNTFALGVVIDPVTMNANFTEIFTKAIYATGDSMSGTLNTFLLTPVTDNTYDLGDSTHAYKDVYIKGNLKISGTSTGIFKTIVVAGQSDVVADSLADTLTLVAGTGVTLTTNASTDTITITTAAIISGADNEMVRMDGTGAIQDSVIVCSDTGALTGITDLTKTGVTVDGPSTAITLSTGTGHNITCPAGTVIPVDASAGSCVLGGLTGGVQGRVVHLIVIGSATMTILNEDASSTNVNRIVLASGTLSPGNRVTLVYYGATTAGRWYGQ